jgi:HK97 family phage major capsid protein
MDERLKALLEERANLWNEAQALMKDVNDSKRTFGAEDTEKYDKLMARMLEIGETVERMEAHAELEAKLKTPEQRAIVTPPNGDGAPGADLDLRFLGDRATATLEAYLRADPMNQPEERERFTRALSAGTEAEGGATIPSVFAAQLIKAMDDQTFIRQWATKFTQPKAESMGVPYLSADPADSEWTTELAIGNEDSTMAFGRRELTPSPNGEYIKVSKKLLRASPLNMDALVRDRLAYKAGITAEKAFLLGTGSNQPLGVFVAHDDGIGTARDVSTGNTTTSMTFDGLIETKYTMKGQYWPKLKWIFHRDGVKQIAKLKDGEGQYIWRPSVIAGEPSTILDTPYAMSEYAPNTFTTGLYVGLLGDFQHYWIVDALSMTIEVATELFIATNQNLYVLRFEADGAPVLAEAFARVKLA